MNNSTPACRAVEHRIPIPLSAMSREEGNGPGAAQDQGGQQTLRSPRSMMNSYVKFVNQTQRSVNVVWLHFEGVQIRYHTLSPGQYLDVNTFKGHPWIFRDSNSGDRLVVQHREVYNPPAWSRSEGWPPQRRRVYITLPVYTLQERCIQVICQNLVSGSADDLALPNPLIAMIKEAPQPARSLSSSSAGLCSLYRSQGSSNSV